MPFPTKPGNSGDLCEALPLLHAGRVQSVALRLIAERESEVEAFQPQEWWSVNAVLSAGNSTTFPVSPCFVWTLDKSADIPSPESVVCSTRDVLYATLKKAYLLTG